jgi:hypothetical protein
MKTEEKKEFRHPDGKIQLLDGRVLDCYPLEDSNILQRVIVRDDEEEKELLRLFLDNAFVLLANRERILSDSRMFLCPLPFCRNGLAYTGTSGFQRPTLGIYLEFWMTCDQACWVDDNDGKWLLHHIAGSPLSGSNRCRFVNERGEERIVQVSEFKKVWTTFMDINRRYADAKVEYEVYSLREVLGILEDEGAKERVEENTHIFFLERTVEDLRCRLTAMKDYAHKVHEQWHEALMEWKCEDLRAFWAEYLKRKTDADDQLAQIREERLALKRLLKSGEISNAEYQNRWMPLHRKLDDIKFGVNNFVAISLNSIFPGIGDRPGIGEVEVFLSRI